VGLLEHINYLLSKKIVLYSKGLIHAYKMEKFQSKISIAHQHLLDFEKFNIKKRLIERNQLVGYVGRLSLEKGIMNFVMAIPKVIEKNKKVKFVIIGDGELREEIQAFIDNQKINNQVEILGWISHENLPDYLNKMKLLVLPSFTEALPRAMLEAMSCGTPVLATQVGAIPDIIHDKKTGFLVKNNSSDYLAEDIIKVLNYPDLEQIAKNARDYVKKEFNIEVATKQFKSALN
jgi:glycosyltransferase involved in cell wall biosynthesis